VAEDRVEPVSGPSVHAVFGPVWARLE